MSGLKIKEIPYSYEYDVITCYEHPLIAAMEYYRSGMGRYYAMLSKCFGTYYSGDVREMIISKMGEVLGYETEELNGCSFRTIKKYIDSGIPLIAGTNLKNIFYSSYYPDRDWAHWMLITDCQDGKMIEVLDNTHHKYIGGAYEEFRMPFRILRSANRGYIKRYGKEYSFQAVVERKKKTRREILGGIMDIYLRLNLRETKSYRQIMLLNLYKKMCNEGQTQGDYLLELKKKIININKYRHLFFEEIKEEMNLMNYHGHQRKIYEEETAALNKKWHIYIMKSLVEAAAPGEKIYVPDEEIVEAECRVQETISEIAKMMSCGGAEETAHESDISGYILENNYGNIIHMKDNKFIFGFGCDRIYNWWDMDDAPKVIMVPASDTEGKNFLFKVSVYMPSRPSEEDACYQPGLFVREGKTGRSIMLGIENGKYLVIDEIGISGQKTEIKKREVYRLYLEIKNGCMTFGTEDEGGKKNVVYTCDTMKDMQAGIACKTWNKAADMEVHFETGASWDI